MFGYLATLPSFLAYFGAALVLTGLFLAAYVMVTPHREFALIRAGNEAAAIALGGALIGFVLPLASAIAHSINLVDLVLWAVVAVIVQLLTYLAARLLKPELPAQIAEGRRAAAIFLAAMSVAVGILNAACLTW